MVKNPGKVFEDSFKKSVPKEHMCYRIKDTSMGFQKSQYSKFTVENPFDFFLLDTYSPTLFCLELKSTKNKYMSFDDITLDGSIKQNNMIHKHQILSLIDYSKYNHVKAGFLLNFRDEKNSQERTYFLDIKDFMELYYKNNKKSLNELDILVFHGIKINGQKKRIRYKWDVEELLNKFRN